MSQKCVAFVETGNFRDFSDGVVKELSVYIMLVPETLYKELSTFSTGFSTGKLKKWREKRNFDSAIGEKVKFVLNRHKI